MWADGLRRSLLEPNGFGRGDSRYQIGGPDHHQQRNEQGADIEQEDVNNIKVDRHGGQVIGGGIELQDLKAVLNKAEEEGDNVAPQHSLTNQKGGEVEEYPADTDVRGSHRLEHADHIGAFQDDDEQAGDHGEPGYY